VGYAGELAREFGGELILLHVVEHLRYPGDRIAPLWTQEFYAEGQAEALEKLRLLSEDIPTKQRHLVRLGRAWAEICKVARDERCDLVVMCKHGGTGLQAAFLGSVAEKVVRHAPCAVLALKPRNKGTV
jgi:nucleotide-binding universal stress UspA family protein